MRVSFAAWSGPFAWLAWLSIGFSLSLPSVLIAQSDGTTTPGAGRGGGAVADFDTLMNLIQQTIAPDDWLINGGTSTMLPYPSGVWIDPRGQFKRTVEDNLDRRISDQFARYEGIRKIERPWQSSSPQRTISLRRLENALAAAAQSGQAPDSELLRLAGLIQITHVQVDAADEDVLISGPADPTRFGYYLEDLAVIASLIKHSTQPLGCSIEPTDEGLRATQELLTEPGLIKRLARTPQMVVEQMQEKLGSHRVLVFGMPARTTTAIALVDADEHMKQLGFGKHATKFSMNSYFDYLDKQATVPEKSLIRWWFAYSDDPILTNSKQNTFQLPTQCVSVLSEQQWLTAQGRAPTGKNDLAADAFAAGITDRLSQLRQVEVCYARLHSVFESALALQLALESTGQADWRAWFPNLTGLGATEQQADIREPKYVAGLATWHKLSSGTIVAVVSGGVKLDPASTGGRANWKTSNFLSSSAIPALNSEAQSNSTWWWD